jgi:hypothetical protein
MDVSTWLHGLGLERHEAAFRDNLIDMDVVRELTESDLEELGLPLGDRKRVLKAIASLPAPELAASVLVAAPRARDEAERRPITAMFCDLVGSTSLAATLDAEIGATSSAPISMTPPRRLANMAATSPKNLATGSWRCSDIRGRRRMMRNGRFARA